MNCSVKCLYQLTCKKNGIVSKILVGIVPQSSEVLLVATVRSVLVFDLKLIHEL